jgi:hypothetical protein
MTFSMSTTASSTRPPMAMARPPSVIVLMDSPKWRNTTTVVRMDSGIATSAISVVRTLPRKSSRMAATQTEAPISLPCSVVMDASMKLAWRKVTCGACRPAGRVSFMSARAASMRPVSAMVSAVGCFWMPRMTAGWPPKPASPRRMAGAKATSATWRSSTAWPLRAVRARLPRSSSFEVRPRWRIRYSRPFSSRKPPEVLDEKPFSAASSCSCVMPRAAMRAVSGCTWNWRTSPPMGMTWATPGIAISRGRSTQSAYSRTAIADKPAAPTLAPLAAPRGGAAPPWGGPAAGPVASIGIAICRISPMMELTGPMRGTTPSGRPSSMDDSRSDTICRARKMSVRQSKVT